MPNLKSDLVIWLIGSCEPHQIVGEETGTSSHPIPITSHYNNQLPTNHEVLKHLFYLKKTTMKGLQLSAVTKKVLTEVFNIWEKATIPTMNQLNANKKLEKLFNRWIWLLKSKKKENEKDKQNRKDFVDVLPKLFDVASPDWESDIKRDKLKSKEEREEDLRFLLDQRGERKEWLGNYSKRYSKALKAKEKRQQQVEKQKEKEEITCQSSSSSQCGSCCLVKTLVPSDLILVFSKNMSIHH